jgi:metallophosphoesterase (TIGR00282 family)
MVVAFIGDIVGRPGRKIVGEFLPKIREEFNIDLVIANYENASHGFGLTEKNAKELFSYGIDVMSGGNHSFDKKEIFSMFDKYPLIRPINYPDSTYGKGVIELDVGDSKVAIINAMGNYTMPICDNPFLKVQACVDELEEKGIKHIILDFHAEATSEKYVMFHLLKDRVSAIFGTHTHIGTDDLMVANGCCYVSDVGLSGCRDQVIGVDKVSPISKFTKSVGEHFKIPNRCKKIMQLIIFELDKNGRTLNAQKLKIYGETKRVYKSFAIVEEF